MPGACRGAAAAATKCGELPVGEAMAEAHFAKEQPSKSLTPESSAAEPPAFNPQLTSVAKLRGVHEMHQYCAWGNSPGVTGAGGKPDAVAASKVVQYVSVPVQNTVIPTPA